MGATSSRNGPRNNANPGVAAPVGSNPFAPAPPGQPGQPGQPPRGVPDEGATGPMLGKGSELEKVPRLTQISGKNAHRFFRPWLMMSKVNPQIFFGGFVKGFVGSIKMIQAICWKFNKKLQ